MHRRSTIWLLFFAAAIAGCRSGKSDLIEAELRYKDKEVRELRSELDRSSMLNEAYENSLREQRFIAPGRPVSNHPLVRQIQIARGTGGIDEDRIPGDEGIQVIIVPQDCDGSAIKVPGCARVTAIQITPEGLKVPLSTWEISAGHLQRNWKSGLLSTGYYVALPWQVVPCQEKLRIIVTFTTTDGATFEAEKDVTIRLGPIDPQRPPATPAPGILQQPTPASLPDTLPAPVPMTSSKPNLNWTSSR